MVYPTPWDAARVREVLTTESRQKARDLFLHTHQPFHQIRVDFCKERDLAEHFVDEEQVYQLIAAGDLRADNRLFFVIGEAGAGKSELCQWLEYRAEPAQRLAIHIPRSLTSAAHVAALLRRALELSGAPVLQRTPISTQARHVALSATILLYEQSEPALTPAAQWAELLDSAPLHAAIAEHLTAALHGDTSHMLLPDAAILSAPSSLDRPTLTTGWPALRRLVAQALEQTLWLGDLRATLRQIADAAVARGIRPLLLLEDVTAFRILGDQLLDYLLDLTSGHFDAVIGATTGFERTQLATATLAGDLTHIHHRLRARFVLTDDHGRTYGLDDAVIALTRGYLAAIRNGHALPAAIQSHCALFGDDLYPFTETALRRAFAALHEEGNPRQTPRLFLEHVLGAALLASEPPPTVLDRSAYLATPPTLFRNDVVDDPRLRSLLRWYGHVAADAVTLDRRIAEVWGIAVPSDLLDGDTIRVPRTYVTSTPEAPSAETQQWQQELRELQQWLETGGLYPSRETLKRGVERILFTLGDPRALGSPDSLSVSRAEVIYARGEERIPIALARSSGDQPVTHASPKVVIQGDPEERGVLEELAYLALSGAEPAQVCPNLALTLDWAERHFNAYQHTIRTLVRESLGGLRIEHLILVSWQMLAGLRGEALDSLPDLRHDPEAVALYAQRTPWDSASQWNCYAAGAELMQRRETFRRLYIGSFTLRDTLLDRARLEVAREGFDATAALHVLADLPLPSLRALPFRVRPTGERLYDLLVPLQRYANALVRLDSAAGLQRDQERLQAYRRQLTVQRGDDPGELRERLALLRWRCGTVGVVWQAAWETALETLATTTPTALDELAAQLDAALAFTAAAPVGDCWTYQQVRHKLRPITAHPYWAALATVERIGNELRRTARSRYRASSKYLSSTTAYHQLLKTVRSIRAALRED